VLRALYELVYKAPVVLRALYVLFSLVQVAYLG